MTCCNRKCGMCTLLSLGGVLITFGAVFALFWNTLYNGILSTELVLTNTSKSYELWKETPIPIYMNIYMFNWTNAEEVIKSKWAVKPNLTECGPYVFSEHHVRVNLTWNENNTVTFQQIRTWKFIPSMSNGNLNDTITNLNPITAVIGNKAKSFNEAIRIGINLVLLAEHENLYFTKTVDELLFTGYEDPILHSLEKFHIKLPFDKFGWFYARNNSASYDGTFTMHTGKSDINLLGELSLWNGLSNTTMYTNSCSIVNGTTGEIWPPVGNRERFGIFSSDLCSEIFFDHNGTEELGNVNGKRFIGTDFTFDNGTKYPEQLCYQDQTVIRSGLRNISRCKFGAPAFVSYPHFYLADPSYLTRIHGLEPNQTLHESHLVVEPVTGIPLAAKAQLQLSLYLEPISGMSIFSDIVPTYMPMMWFSQVATLTQEYSTLTDLLVKLGVLGTYLGWSVFCLGLIFSIAGFIMLFKSELMDEEQDLLIANEETPHS